MTETPVREYPPGGPIGLPLPQRKRPRWKRALPVIAVGGLLLFGGVGMSTQSPLPVRSIEVVGASPDLRPQINAAVAVSPGQSFASVDTSAVAERVVAIEGIDEAKVRWGWWGKLVVAVREQHPVALAAGPSGGFTVLDAAGKPIRTAAERPVGFVLVEASEDRLLDALTVAQALSPQLLAVTDGVVVNPGSDTVSLRLANGAWVPLGKPEDLERKLALVLQLLPTGATMINLSVPERPALSGLPEPEPST